MPASSRTFLPVMCCSGRGDSNPQRPAWKAGTLGMIHRRRLLAKKAYNHTFTLVATQIAACSPLAGSMAYEYNFVGLKGL